MYCSTCGARVPVGRAACGTCGTRLPVGDVVQRAPALNPLAPAGAAPLAGTVPTCPRCEFRGHGIPYFSRGGHVAVLVTATVLTLPGALGIGGILYYWFRHQHLVCPRCGFGWGRRSEMNSSLPAEPVRTAPRHASGPPRTLDGFLRAWSILLFLVGFVLLGVGAVELEAAALLFGGLALGGGYVLHRGANRARERRREALLANLQMHVLRLAREREGRLTVTDVATALAWPIKRAEKVLHSLDDGWRVNSEVTDEGLIVYEFRELMPGRGSPELPEA